MGRNNIKICQKLTNVRENHFKMAVQSKNVPVIQSYVSTSKCWNLKTIKEMVITSNNSNHTHWKYPYLRRSNCVNLCWSKYKIMGRYVTSKPNIPLWTGHKRPISSKMMCPITHYQVPRHQRRISLEKGSTQCQAKIAIKQCLNRGSLPLPETNFRWRSLAYINVENGLLS